jgi:hypothetical protein
MKKRGTAILWSFGMFHKEKSGNPVSGANRELVVFNKGVLIFDRKFSFKLKILKNSKRRNKRQL